jgi:hypothetical protein
VRDIEGVKNMKRIQVKLFVGQVSISSVIDLFIWGSWARDSKVDDSLS